ncbi:g5936 [Coccomyxa elongata]
MSIAAWWELSNAFMAFPSIKPMIAAFLPLAQGRDWWAFIVSAFFAIASALLFGLLSTWYGQVMLESGITVALGMSVFGTWLKFNSKLATWSNK